MGLTVVCVRQVTPAIRVLTASVTLSRVYMAGTAALKMDEARTPAIVLVHGRVQPAIKVSSAVQILARMLQLAHCGVRAFRTISQVTPASANLVTLARDVSIACVTRRRTHACIREFARCLQQTERIPASAKANGTVNTVITALRVIRAPAKTVGLAIRMTLMDIHAIAGRGTLARAPVTRASATRIPA